MKKMLVCLYVVALSTIALSEVPTSIEHNADGVHVARRVERDVLVSKIKDMKQAGIVVSEMLETGTVLRLIMSDESNANMRFFRELKKSDSVERVRLTNINENNLIVSQVLKLFPNVIDLSIIWAGRVDVDFSSTPKLTDLDIDGVLTRKSISSLANHPNIEYVNFFVDKDIEYKDIKSFQTSKSIKKVKVYGYGDYEIPKSWQELLSKDERLSKILELE